VEFLANVDQPAESKLWVQYYRRAQAQLQPQGGGGGTGKEGGCSGGALVCHIPAQRPREPRIQPMARMARGKLLALLQDDDAGPKQCDWIAQVNAQVDARLRTVVVGLNLGAIKGPGGSAAMWREGLSRDTLTGAWADSSLLVDVGPLSPRRYLIESGGSMSRGDHGGRRGYLSDWELTVRAWAAGERVSPCALLCCCYKRPVC